MASSKSYGNPVCPMCFETPAVMKIVGTCKHAFCTECLSSHLESLSPGSEVFLCPTCRGECVLPSFGVDGLVDCSDVEVEVTLSRIKNVRLKSDEEKPATNKIFMECRSCRLRKGTTVPADNLCEECGNVYLCHDCSRVHGNNKVTQDHVLILLKSIGRKKYESCEAHTDLMKNYCCTCSKPVCSFCIMFDHGNHDVKKINEMFRSMVDEVRSIARKQETRSKELVNLKLLNLLTSSLMDKNKTLMKAIEDHAQICIYRIKQQKEALKEKVMNKFKDVKDETVCLDKIPDLVDRLDKSVTNANTLLMSDLHPAEFEKLFAVKYEMEAAGKLADGIDGENCWEFYEMLYQNTPNFVRNTTDFAIGTLEVRNTAQGMLWIGQLKSERKFEVDDEAKFVPCVANLGKDFYAVAHPTIDGEASHAIDIYEYPGTLNRLKQTLSEHVYPLYDMAATPDGKLAVLSDGSTPGHTCCIRIFDPESGYVRSSADFPLRGQLSFDVNLRHQYVILNNDEGRRITVFREDGSIVLTHSVDTDCQDVENPSRISCGGLYVIINGENGPAVYEQSEQELVPVTTKKEIGPTRPIKDISATCSGELGVFINTELDTGDFARTTLKHGEISGWNYKFGIGKIAQGANLHSRLSVRDRSGYVVISQGHTVIIYSA